jgi:methylmalonyl-CoA mutase, N-terminal domain
MDKEKLDKIKAQKEQWENMTLKPHLGVKGERCKEFITTSSKPIGRIYTPLDMPNFDYVKDLGFPSEYPYIRGVHPTMYRGQLWTMRQFSGFGTAEDTN